MTDSVAGLLVDLGIKPRPIRPGQTVHMTCPRCAGGKTREQSLAVTVDPDGMGVVVLCHRGTCGWSEGRRVHTDGPRQSHPERPQERAVRPPPPHPAEVAQNRPDALYAFFQRRGIGAETVDAFGVYIATHWFPAHGDLSEGEHAAIVFPYVFKGRVVNRKYRSAAKMFMQEKDPLPTLFNVDAVTSPDVVLFCEGEGDVMALHEAGYPQAVSLPNGAPAELRDEDDPRRETDRRFDPLRTHADLLGAVKRFVLAGDNDAPGLVLREELARRLGRHRCWVVTWPDGCKDACDVLREHGPERVRACVESAEPWPVEGIQRLEPNTLLDLRRAPPPPVLLTGLHELDAVIRWPGEGRLIVVTGYPGSGKSTFARWVMVQLMLNYNNRKFQVFSPENSPWSEFAATCAEVLVGKPFRTYGRADAEPMTDQEVLWATEWLRSRITFLVADAADKAPTLEWILERGGMSVLREGTTDLVIDPFNQVEAQRGGLSETDYIGLCLQRISAFCLRHGCNCWVIVHPAKTQPAKPGGELPVPTLRDASGSAHWWNRSDLGLTVHASGGGGARVIVQKMRFSRWGQRSGAVELGLDVPTGRYFSMGPPPPSYDEASLP